MQTFTIFLHLRKRLCTTSYNTKSPVTCNAVSALSKTNFDSNSIHRYRSWLHNYNLYSYSFLTVHTSIRCMLFARGRAHFYPDCYISLIWTLISVKITFFYSIIVSIWTHWIVMKFITTQILILRCKCRILSLIKDGCECLSLRIYNIGSSQWFNVKKIAIKRQNQNLVLAQILQLH